MPSPLDSAQFVRLMDKRLRKVVEAPFKELPTMIPEVYNVMSTDSAWEEFMDIGAVPDVPEFSGQITYLSIAPGFNTKIEPKEYAGGLQFERKLLDDKKYPVLDQRSKGLGTAAQRTREKLGVRIFAYGFSTAFDFMTSEEGIALCGSHLTKADGVSTATGFSNSGTSAFSKTSVAATRLLMRRFKNDIGQRIDLGDDLELWVPDNLADLAYTIVRTKEGLDSADKNVNMQYGRYEVKPYLRLDDYDTNNWFMTSKSQRKNDFLWLDRIKPESKFTVDFDTYISKEAIYFRCAYGWIGWRGLYGHNVS